MTDTPARLVRLAQQLEDQHAPQHMTILMREAAKEMEGLRAALRPLACTCEAKHQAECSRSEVDCPFWNARAALGEKE